MAKLICDYMRIFGPEAIGLVNEAVNFLEKKVLASGENKLDVQPWFEQEVLHFQPDDGCAMLKERIPLTRFISGYFQEKHKLSSYMSLVIRTPEGRKYVLHRVKRIEK